MVDQHPASRTGGTENQFRNPLEIARAGITAARIGDFEEGYKLLGDACDRIRRSGEKVPAPAISYFGLCLAICKERYREAAGFCQAAIDADPVRPEYYLNLARVCAAGGSRRKAIAAIERGLALEPNDPHLLQLRTSLGVRRRPVIFFLSRSHPLNVSLGRIRHALSKPIGPPAPPGGGPKRG